MFSKISSKNGLILLAVLLAVVVIVKISDSRKGERSFRKEIASFDIDEIDGMVIYPKLPGKQLTFVKEGDLWRVGTGEKMYMADNAVVNRMISQLNGIKPESVVTTNEKNWGQYDLADSASVRVSLKSGKDLVADLRVGKYSFQQSRKVTSYVRLEGENAVYGVDGYVAMSFNGDMALERFRFKQLVERSKDSWTKLSFNYPDGAFTMSRDSVSWKIDGVEADSASVVDYLNAINGLSGSEFTNATPTGSRLTVKIEGNNMPAPIELYASGAGEERVIWSSLGSDSFFKDANGLFSKIFVKKEELLN